MHRVRTRALPLVAMLALASCASVRFDRTTATSGTFRSSAFAFTILSWDLPQRAVDVATENASDARQPNTVATNQTVFPYLGPFDFLLDVIGVRYAVVSGTWGYADDSGPGEPPH
ncbi:MAG: hypothetical protein R3F34_14455 [Planctomycetota bacterium]